MPGQVRRDFGVRQSGVGAADVAGAIVDHPAGALHGVLHEPRDERAQIEVAEPVGQLEVRALDDLPLQVDEQVVDADDVIADGIADDVLAQRLIGRDAAVDDRLRGELRDRAVDVDLIPVERHRQPVDARRLEHDAGRRGVGFLGTHVRVAAREARRRNRRVVLERIIDRDAAARLVEALAQRRGAHVARLRQRAA